MPRINLKSVVWKEGKYFVALSLNTNVSSFGKTRKEALASLQEALELYFEDKSNLSFSKIERPNIVQSSLQYA
ncbi:MAG: type II toxin-antitoxin system HicB family antitoxin [Candidatus Peribacteraceae bacterium]|nr:type II toxin-antitoxin system HicB family antitoxin [Candidatus Peribacteraceae bacterium]